MKLELNRIYNGDAYKLIKLIEDKSVDLIITDPPYDIGTTHGSGIMKDRGGTYMQQIEENSLNYGIDNAILDEFCRIMKHINIYIWCNRAQILDYLKYFVEERGCSYEILIWKKENPIPLCGLHYLIDKEYCLLFKETGAYIHVPYERGRTVFSTYTNVKDKEDFKHPTIKPLFITEQLILNSSEAGGVVFDPFIGSGTTAVAAKALNRKYLGFEINPYFYKIAVDRINGINQKGELNLFETDFESLQLEFEKENKDGNN